MHSHDDLLPIELAPVPGESGVGFLLRLASTNGLSMTKLRQLVGMTESETFTSRHEDRLFALVGLTDTRPFNLLPHWTKGGGAVCYGHRFRVRTMLRFRRPQYCPACVREVPVSTAHWDLSASVVCLRHGCLLQDHCPTCRAQVRWNRPSVQWSHCKHYLGRGSPKEEMPAELMAAQKITEDLLLYRDPDFSGLGLSCKGLSLDGWGSLLWALGLVEAPHSPPSRTVLSGAPSSASAYAIVRRAVERLRIFVHGDSGPASLAPVVADVPLTKAILDPSGTFDRAILMSWYGFIFGERQVTNLVRRHRELSQLSLF